MADQSEVADVLVALLGAAIYPNGTAQPSSVSAPVIVYQGWPRPETLDKDLAAGKSHVSVYPRTEAKDTSGIGRQLEPVRQDASGTTLTVDGVTVTVGGDPEPGETLGLFVDGVPVAYAVQESDTTTSIAAALATIINQSQPASSSGPEITIPGAHSISVTVQGQWDAVTVLRRQRRLFQVTVWSPKHAIRDALAKAADTALALNIRINLPEGAQATLTYNRDMQSDEQQKVTIYRRDIFYFVEYPVTVQERAPAVSAPFVNISVNAS